MKSTKSIYTTNFWICAVCLGFGIFLAVLDFTDILGFSMIIVGLAFCIFSLVKIARVKNIEKNCMVCEGRFVGVESTRTSIFLRRPRFSIMVEINVGGGKKVVRTPGIYSSYHISSLTDKSMIKIGYTENFEQIITL